MSKFYKSASKKTGIRGNETVHGMPKVKNVIFNPPATIVFWSDGTKTVAKACGRDEFDPERGLSMAIAKKALGNGAYGEMKRWMQNYKPIRRYVIAFDTGTLTLDYEDDYDE